MNMQLKSLSIQRMEIWQDPKRPLTGQIKMEGLHGEVTLKLSEEHARQILEIVAASARETTEQAMRAMTAEVFSLGDTPALAA